MECAIDEWITGLRTDITFTAESYRSVYKKHLKDLQMFDEASKELGVLDQIRARISSDGR